MRLTRNYGNFIYDLQLFWFNCNLYLDCKDTLQNKYCVCVEVLPKCFGFRKRELTNKNVEYYLYLFFIGFYIEINSIETQ